jgi:hypothetical protein
MQQQNQLGSPQAQPSRNGGFFKNGSKLPQAPLSVKNSVGSNYSSGTFEKQ